MALKEIAVVGCVLSVGTPIVGGAFTITTSPSATCSIDGKYIFSGPLVWTFTGGSATGAVPGSINSGGTISPTAVYAKVDNKLVIRVGDSVTGASFIGVNTETGAPISYSADVEISSAGQTFVKAE